MKENQRKKLILSLTMASALLGIVFSLIYFIFDIFIPAASALSLCLMFIFMLLLLREYPEYFTKKQSVIFMILIWIGLLIGVLAAILQLIIYFKLL